MAFVTATFRGLGIAAVAAAANAAPHYLEPSRLTWIFVTGFMLCVVMCFATGANDVSNSFGPSVGSGSLSLSRALFFAAIFETAGALALSRRVSQTLEIGIGDLACFEDQPSLLMVSSAAALIASSAWVLGATLLGLPVSTTHSIVGSIAGATAILRGVRCIHWDIGGLGQIFVSWVVSPFMSFALAFLIYFGISRLVFHAPDPLSRALATLPGLALVTTFVLGMLVLYDNLNYGIGYRLLTVGGLSLVVGSGTWLVIRYHFRDRLFSRVVVDQAAADTDSDVEHKRVVVAEVAVVIDAATPAPSVDRRRPFLLMQAQTVFWALQNVTACLSAFSHGSNDTANSVTPFSVIFYTFRTGAVTFGEPVPYWVILIGAAAIVFGLAFLGHRVIKTTGTQITRLNYVNGFSTELGTVATVVLASHLKVPVSSTHCQIGALTGSALVPYLRKRFLGQQDEVAKAFAPSVRAGGDAAAPDLAVSLKQTINWVVIRNIVMSWLVTLPISALGAAVVAYLLQMAIKV